MIIIVFTFGVCLCVCVYVCVFVCVFVCVSAAVYTLSGRNLLLVSPRRDLRDYSSYLWCVFVCLCVCVCVCVGECVSAAVSPINI